MLASRPPENIGHSELGEARTAMRRHDSLDAALGGGEPARTGARGGAAFKEHKPSNLFSLRVTNITG